MVAADKLVMVRLVLLASTVVCEIWPHITLQEETAIIIIISAQQQKYCTHALKVAAHLYLASSELYSTGAVQATFREMSSTVVTTTVVGKARNEKCTMYTLTITTSLHYWFIIGNIC